MNTIVIYIPNRGQIETETVESLLHVTTHPRTRETPIGVHFHTGDSLIPRARNECAAHFLASDAKAMLFVDSDIVFEPEDIFTLFDAKIDLIGADYHVARRSVRTDEERSVIELRSDAPRIAPVDRLPTGFLLICRLVIERLAQTAKTYVDRFGAKRYDFFSPFVHDNAYLSEDFAFTERAVRAGFVPHLYRDIRLGHIGRKEWRTA